MAFRKLLLDSYLAWQKDVAKKAMPQAAYAKHIGVSPGAFSNYLNGKRVPKSEKELKKLSLKLGLEVYDSLGLPRPDPRLKLVIERWGLLPDAVKEEVSQTVQRATERAGASQRGRVRMDAPERR